MDASLIDIAPDSLEREDLCCIIRKKPGHPGIESKKRWLADRLREGHVLRKVAGEACAFIEYAPLEKAWVPVEGDGFLYIYCLWVQGEAKGRGFGRLLMESCLADARAQGRSGVCMLGAQKQKAWLSDQRFAEKFGFVPVDTTQDGYTLLALSFDGSVPHFAPSVKAGSSEQGVTVYYDDQCPFLAQRIEKLRAYCAQNGIAANFIHVDTLERAKTLPCVFNDHAVTIDGRLATVNQIDGAGLERLLRDAARRA